MNPDTFAADSAALASAASAAEEALQLEREALSVLRDGWSGDSASAAAEFIDSHLREGEAVVSALRRASGVLAALGEAHDNAAPAAAHDQVQAELADRPPSAFASPVPAPPVSASPPAAASGMNWPSMSVPAPPDLGGAIANLIARAADAFGVDAGNVADGTTALPADSVTEVKKPTVPAAPGPVANSPVVNAVAAPAPQVPAAAPISPASEPGQPLLAAEIPPPEPLPAPAPAETPDRTPCEIAADELPQIGR